MAEQELRDILDMQQAVIRVKRAVLPIGGKVLRWAFGTLTRSDLKKINKHIDVLAGNQQRLTHILNQTLSVVNITRIEVQQNRHAIRTMADIVQGMELRLNDYRALQKNLHMFVITYTQVDMMLAELREAVEKGMFYMDNVRMMLGQLSVGHLAPTVIPSNELRQLSLIHI